MPQPVKVAVVPTGVNYLGCKIALLVPASQPPGPVAKEFCTDFAWMVQEARKPNVEDFQRLVFRKIREMQDGN